MKIKNTLCIVLIVILIVSLTSCFGPDVDLVKEATTYKYPDITWNEALNKVCKDGDWSSFVSDDDKEIIEYSGILIVTNEKVLLQFILADDSYDVYYAEIGGEKIPDDGSLEALVDYIFVGE